MVGVLDHDRSSIGGYCRDGQVGVRRNCPVHVPVLYSKYLCTYVPLLDIQGMGLNLGLSGSVRNLVESCGGVCTEDEEG